MYIAALDYLVIFLEKHERNGQHSVFIEIRKKYNNKH
jgi:hypothetical protein